MIKDIKGFAGEALKALGIGILGVSALALGLMAALGLIAITMTIPAGILWYVLPLLGYVVEFHKLWAGCIVLRIIGGLLFNHSSTTVTKE